MTLTSPDPSSLNRCTINTSTAAANDYAWINMFPMSVDFALDKHTAPDSNGWPTVDTGSGQLIQFSFTFPDSSNFSGPYGLAWDGDGTVHFGVGIGTVDTGSSSGTYTEDSPGVQYSGTGPVEIVFNRTGGTLDFIICRVLHTDRSSTGNYLKNLKMYRMADKSRMLAGNLVRLAYLQQIVDLNPGAIRWMDLMQMNFHTIRWENRTANIPNYGGSNPIAGPLYGTTTGTNQYSIAAVTTGANQTPATMQHGEVCQLTFGNASTHGGTYNISSITNSATPVVTTTTTHPYSNGDLVIHRNLGGMTQLNLVPCTVSNVTATTYQINVNTTGFSTYTSGGYVTMHYTLNVGGRGAYPITWNSMAQMGEFGDGYVQAGGIQPLVFDKDYVCSTAVTGAWIFFLQTAAFPVHDTGIPIEVATRYMYELNALATSQSKGPINMWINTPIRGLISTDQDYSSGSNWCVNAINIVKNGNGASFPGLQPYVYIIHELANEHWNGGEPGNACGALSFARWNAQDVDGYYCLRAGQVIKELKAAYPNDPQILYVLGSWAGFPGGVAQIFSGGGNAGSDSLNTWHTPVIDQGDAACIAPYIDATDPNSIWQTYAARWAATSDQAIRDGIIATYIKLHYGTGLSDSATTIGFFTKGMLAQHFALVNAHGKKLYGYEGGSNWGSATNLGITDSQALFLMAVRSSKAWGIAWNNFLTTYRAMGGLLAGHYTTVGDDGDSGSGTITIEQSTQGNRWSYNGTSFDTYGSDHVEGSAYDYAWAAMKHFNNTVPTKSRSKGSF